MERRSYRIHEHRERAAERQVLEIEEKSIPLRGRQTRGNHRHHNQRHGRPQENNIPVIEEVQEEGEDEVEQTVGNDSVQGEEPPPPPPTLAEVMDRQT